MRSVAITPTPVFLLVNQSWFLVYKVLNIVAQFRKYLKTNTILILGHAKFISQSSRYRLQKNLVSGFANTGIFPLDPDKILSTVYKKPEKLPTDVVGNASEALKKIEEILLVDVGVSPRRVHALRLSLETAIAGK